MSVVSRLNLAQEKGLLQCYSFITVMKMIGEDILLSTSWAFSLFAYVRKKSLANTGGRNNCT